ncbi:hypothetical protein [Bifidobacterium sp.]|uniref:hypothetical protein n=1 Tax=Bifidobacterium sp. TaxID=41200 RepID=UPI00284DF445|nr:hypothetical protein [Bifidobacterium sp.]MDR3801529.1 hypothetical protein [Bifidobacterium sp.]
MTMTVGARSLDNEERSNFRDYMSLLSLSVVLAVACFGLLLPFLRLAVGIVLLVVRLLASLARSMGAGR